MCVAKVEGYLGQSKDYEWVCARIRGELQNGRKCWEAFGLVWGPLNCLWGLDSRKRHLGISSELSCSQYLLLLLQLGGKGAPRTTLLLCRTVLFVFCFCGGLMQWAQGL